MTVLDIGANVGLIAKPLAEAVGLTGVVYAMEPHATLAPYLRDIGPQVRVLTMAASDHDDEGLLYHSKETPHASLYHGNVLDPQNYSTPVRLVTLDALQVSGELPTPIHVIKADAQGAEAAILRGAQRLMATQKPVLFLELWSEGLQGAGDSVDVVRQLAAAHGYEPQGWTWDAACDHARGCNGHGSIDVILVAKES